MSITVSEKKVEGKDLRQLDLFAGLDENDLKNLASLCRIENIEKNTIVYSPGSCREDVYFLTGKNDSVQIELPIEGFSDNVVTHTLRKGELFGWCTLVPHQLRTTLVRCIEDTEVIAMKGDALMYLIDTDNRLGYRIMKNLSAIIASRLTYTSVSLRYLVRQLTNSE
jgi:CRP/FNR family transcriptional regulator, cyclic AMP receptor protein